MKAAMNIWKKKSKPQIIHQMQKCQYKAIKNKEEWEWNIQLKVMKMKKRKKKE